MILNLVFRVHERIRIFALHHTHHMSQACICGSCLSAIMRFQCIVVGPPGRWKVVTLKTRRQEEKWEHWELQGPGRWQTYETRDKLGRVRKVETNVRYVHRIWRRPVGEAAEVVEEEREIRPWVHIDRYDRTDLRVDLAGLSKNVFWHSALWYFFHNKGFFKSWVAFRKSIISTTGYRVDHLGGNPAVVDVMRLDLILASRSATQGGAQRKLYKRQGTLVLTERRLKKQPATKRRIRKRPARCVS